MSFGGIAMSVSIDRWSPLAALDGENAYRTSDLEAARQHIGSLFVPHQLDVIGEKQRLDVCVSRARLEGVSLVYHRHGASVRVRPEPFRNFFLLQIPLAGEAIIRLGQQEITCNPTQAVMISPQQGADMRFSSGCEQLIVRIEKCDLERHLQAQLARDLGRPLEFAPAVPLLSPGGQEIKALLHLMTASLLAGQGMCSSPITRKHMVSLLLSGLLTCLENNYRDEFGQAAREPKPSYIRKAQEFIANNVCEPIGPEEIAAAAQVSARALYAGFQRILNTTPMRYLRQLRLDMVHERLLKSDARRTSVTDVALQLGFQHLGHFCAAYKERFGELPRDTLGRRYRQTVEFDH
jgi:AraC-like DNA-binding protein